MSTSNNQRGRPPSGVPRKRPASVTSGRSGASMEVRLPAPPRDHLPEPREVRVPDREIVPAEVQSDVQTRTSQNLPARRSGPAPRGPSSRELLRRALSTPGAARLGLLLREVLGPPVSLRTDTHDRPT